MITSFEPISAPNANILILGSMPGVKSLDEHQYYAHPRNAFWPIIKEHILNHPELQFDQRLIQNWSAYPTRLSALTTAGLALWDVVSTCVREGSLDASIQADSVRANDFNQFFHEHLQIRRVLFNGKTAAALFKRHVLPKLDTVLMEHLEFQVLPSTSPANARLKLEEKIGIWLAWLSS